MAYEGNLSQWESEVRPLVGPLLAELNVALGTTSHNADTMLASSDQFRAVAREVVEWMPAHPCPVPDIDGSFVRLARSYDALADLLETEAKQRNGIDWPAIDREMTLLHIKLVRTLALMRVRAEH